MCTSTVYVTRQYVIHYTEHRSAKTAALVTELYCHTDENVIDLALIG